MAGGLNGVGRIGAGFGPNQPHRVKAKDEREREEQADFAELVEHSTAHPEPEEQPRAAEDESLDAGYPSEDETGTSLDLKA